MQMRHKPFEDIVQPRVFALCIDAMDILGNVLYCEVLEYRHIDMRRIHVSLDKEYESVGPFLSSLML
jgi:hypothetical protein